MTSNHKTRKYSIVPYDPKWKELFQKESDVLKNIFGGKAIAIEHVGSTSVDGMAGKPTIDILILVDDIKHGEEKRGEMERAGYKYLGEYVKEGVILFAKEENDTRLVNVHVSPKNDSEAQQMLKIRDYFRNNPEAIEEYSKLKLDLFSKYPDDYGMYRKYKDEWMESLLKNIFYKKES